MKENVSVTLIRILLTTLKDVYLTILQTKRSKDLYTKTLTLSTRQIEKEELEKCSEQ